MLTRAAAVVCDELFLLQDVDSDSRRERSRSRERRRRRSRSDSRERCVPSAAVVCRTGGSEGFICCEDRCGVSRACVVVVAPVACLPAALWARVFLPPRFLTTAGGTHKLNELCSLGNLSVSFSLSLSPPPILSRKQASHIHNTYIPPCKVARLCTYNPAWVPIDETGFVATSLFSSWCVFSRVGWEGNVPVRHGTHTCSGSLI